MEALSLVSLSNRSRSQIPSVNHAWQASSIAFQSPKLLSIVQASHSSWCTQMSMVLSLFAPDTTIATGSPSLTMPVATGQCCLSKTRVAHLQHLNSTRPWQRTSSTAGSRACAMTRVESTCLLSGSRFVLLRESSASTLCVQSLIRMELQNAPIALSWRASSLCSMRRSCLAPSGGMLLLRSSMCTTGPPLQQIAPSLPSSSGMAPNLMWRIFAFLAALPMCM